MPLTNAQRQTAIQAVLASQDIMALSPIPAGTPLGTLIPGDTAAAVLAGLVTAIGTGFDAALTTVLTNLTAIYNVQLTAAEATVTSLEAQIAAL
jgi:hypothetical protein